MTDEIIKVIETTQLVANEPQPSRKTIIASALCSALRYGSIAALSGVFIAAGMGHHLKDIALKMVSSHDCWMPMTKQLADAFAFISIGLGVTSMAEFFAKCAKNCSRSNTIEDQPLRARTKMEKAGIAVKTIYNLGLAGVSTAAAYYSVKFIALFAKAAVALKGSHLLNALKNTGKALNMSSVFSHVFAAVGIAHAVKGLFKTCVSAVQYTTRKGQANRPAGNKVIKQGVKTFLKIAAAVGGVLCASVPIIGWALLGVASLTLTAWSLSKIWRSKKAKMKTISRENSSDSMSVASVVTGTNINKDTRNLVVNDDVVLDKLPSVNQQPTKLPVIEHSSTVWREALPYVPVFNGCSVSPVL